MTLGILIKRSKHDGENDFDIVTDKVAEVLVVPKVKCSLSDLIIPSASSYIEPKYCGIPENGG